MYLEGFKYILNIDSSAICIEIIKERYANDDRFDKNQFYYI